MIKKILKLGLFATILLLTVSINAQSRGHRGNGGSQRGQSQNRSQGQGQRMMPAFNAKNAIGILKFDDVIVCKKAKIKNKSEKLKVARFISEYNHTIDELLFLHFETIKTTEEFVSLKRKEAITNKDMKAMRFIQMEAMEDLNPIKNKVDEADLLLNTKLERLLSNKQFKKWEKYQKLKRKELKPKRPEGNKGSSQSSQRGSRGGKRGF